MSRDLRLQKFKTISPFICKFSENGLLMHICMYALHTTQYTVRTRSVIAKPDFHNPSGSDTRLQEKKAWLRLHNTAYETYSI